MNDDRLDDPLLHQYRREPDPRFARSLRERLRRAERPQGIPRPVMRALAAACAIGVVVALFAIPSVRVSAQALLDLFRVRRFAAVQFDEARFEALRSADQDQGLLVFDRKETIRDAGPPRYVPTRDAASPEAGFAVSEPSYLPEGLRADSMFIQGEGEMRFTVSEAKLRSLLDRLDVKGVTVPSGLDGHWVEVRKPAVVMQKFRSPRRHAVLIQAKSPEVSIPPGWDVEQLGEIGLRALGLNASEARRIAKATDWRNTLLVPVPLDVTTFRQVTVQGNSGLLITTKGETGPDGNHREGTMLMWTSGDRVYCLRGTLSAREVMLMAESLPS
jgi:uncharacterized protein DUF4367